VASIVLGHVTKRYADSTEEVNDMNLAIADGEFMILVGPSGSGKSTALRMVAGLEDVTEGVIRIGDDVVNDLAPRDRDIAMVFQNYALYPHMTVRPDEIQAMLDAIPDLRSTLRTVALDQLADLFDAFDVTAIYDKPN
jgi:ABC-type sugar transport system ATPase subunit